jgi:hypothetical protein
MVTTITIDTTVNIMTTGTVTLPDLAVTTRRPIGGAAPVGPTPRQVERERVDLD